MSSITQSPAVPTKGWVFRAHAIPLQWSEQDLVEHLQELYPGSELQIDSLYKAPTGKTKTALVTFHSPVPNSLSTESDARNWLRIGKGRICLGHCLGLTTLFEPGEGESPKVDVVFVHGLAGHAIGSWMALNGSCWPRDFLGNDLEGARVLSYGYEAKLIKDTSTSQLSDFGRQLLGDLPDFRPTAEDKERPLFLVGHSFGGTIINWVLHELSSKQDQEYEDILRAVRCATFFGTPHQGMDIKYLLDLVRDRAHGNMERLLRDLQPNSELLRGLQDSLRRLAKRTNVRVITCVEQKLTLAKSINGQPEKLYEMVNMDAARTYSQNEEDVIPIHATHQGMVKFEDESDTAYRQVLRKLKGALKDCGQTAIMRILTGEQRRDLLESLAVPEAEECQTTIKDAHGSTCEWFFQCLEYTKWASTSNRAKDEAPILWIKGNTGSGKSTVMKFAFKHHQLGSSNRLAIAFFFDGGGTAFQKTCKGMYQSLLLQVLRATQNIPSEIPALDQLKQDRSLKWQTPALKELLEHIIPRLGRPVVCFVDALDVCQPSDLPDMAAFFQRLTQLCAKKQTVFRVCFSSRPVMDVPTQQRRSLCLEEQDGHKRDILTYIEHNLQTVPRNIQQAMQQKASGIFLWAVLAVEFLRKEPSSWGRASLLRQKLDEIPADLPGLYRHVLTRDTNENERQQKLLKCLELVLSEAKPHTATSLYLLTQSDADRLQVGQSGHVDDPALEFLQDTSRGLIEMRDAHAPVRFIHVSVPDFLHSDEGISQVWRESPDGFRGKSHNRMVDGYLDVIQHCPTETAEQNGYTQHPCWQNDRRCIDRGLNGAIGYDNDPWRGYAEGVDDGELSHAAGAALEYYRGMDNGAYQPHSETKHLPPVPPLDPQSKAAQHAVENILYHANAAEKGGVPQAEFLRQFPLRRWIELSVTLSDPPPTYTPEASLLYVLTEQNAAELIAAHPNRHSYLDPERQLCGTPFFVALAKGNVNAIQAFFRIEQQQQQQQRQQRQQSATVQPPNFLDQRSAPERYKRLCADYVEAVLELPTDFIHHQLCGWEETTAADHRSVTAYMKQPGNEVLHMYLLLTGRASLNDDGNKHNNDRVASELFNWSAQHGRVAFLELFFREGGLDPNGPAGVTALSLAAEEGRANVVSMLLDAASGLKQFDTKDPHSGCTPLAAAAAGGHAEVARLLLTSGKVNVEAKDKDGRTPLALAALSGSVEVVRLLLSCGVVRLDGRDNMGRTSLSLAAGAGSVGVVEILVRAGADADLGDADRRAPLSWAAEEGLVDVVKFLVKVCRVEKGAKDIHGKKALDYVSWGRHCLNASEHGLIAEYDAVISMLGKGNSQKRLVPSHEEKPKHQPASPRGRLPGYDQHPQHVNAETNHNYAAQYHTSLRHEEPYEQHSYFQSGPQYVGNPHHAEHTHHVEHIHHGAESPDGANWQQEAASPQVASYQHCDESDEYEPYGHANAYIDHSSGGGNDEIDGYGHEGYEHAMCEGNGYGHPVEEDSRYGDDGNDGCDDDESEVEGYDYDD